MKTFNLLLEEWSETKLNIILKMKCLIFLFVVIASANMSLEEINKKIKQNEDQLAALENIKAYQS